MIAFRGQRKSFLQGQSKCTSRLNIMSIICNLTIQNLELWKAKQNQNRTKASTTFTFLGFFLSPLLLLPSALNSILITVIRVWSSTVLFAISVDSEILFLISLFIHSQILIKHKYSIYLNTWRHIYKLRI